MFDFDVGKLVVIGVVALVVIGPKDLPRVMRQVGGAMGKMRRMANEFQSQFMEAMREADVEDLKKDLDKAADAIKLDSAFDPLKDAHNDLVKSIEDQSSAVEALASVDAPAAPPESLDPAMDAAQGAAEPAPVESRSAGAPRLRGGDAGAARACPARAREGRRAGNQGQGACAGSQGRGACAGSQGMSVEP